MNELTLRKLQDEDIPLFTLWLNQDYILKWFLDADDWLLEINGRKDEFSWIHHFIVMKDDEAVGFCQYYDCHDANAMEEWFEVTEPNHTFSIDYMIGEKRYLGQGLGKEIVRQVTDLIQQKENLQQIIVQPDRS